MTFTNEDKFVVLAAVQRLDQKSRLVIFLRFWDDYSIEEIAYELRLTWDDAQKLLNNSLLQLRRMIIFESSFEEYSKRELLLNTLRRSHNEVFFCEEDTIK